jgi:putative DNA primase/helicase
VIAEKCPVCETEYATANDDTSELRRKSAYITLPGGFLRCRRPECRCGAAHTGRTKGGKPRGLPLDEWLALLGVGRNAPERAAEVERGLGVTLRDAPFTDAGNAERLLKFAEGNVRFVPERGWLRWDSERAAWLFDTAWMTVLATMTARATYMAAPEGQGGEELRKNARRMESANRLESATKIAATEPSIRIAAAALDADGWALPLANVTIDLRTGQPRARVREDLVTRVVAIQFDATAKCPRWRLFLMEITGGDSGLVAYLQRAVGYSLTGRTVEACIFLIVGFGRNGKSVLVEVIRALLGPYAAAADFTTFVSRRSEAARNDLARLQGVRLVTASESARGVVLDEALIKSITGGDTISARFLYAEFFEFRPVLKLWLVSNHLPTIRGDDLGIWRRIRLVNLAKPIDEALVDPYLVEKLLAELPGILNWAIEGALEWQRQGLAPPDAVLAATAEYRSGMDVLGEFLTARCNVGPDLRTPAAPLQAAYRTFMQSAGEPPLSPTDFAAALRARGFTSERDARARMWVGLALQVTP